MSFLSPKMPSLPPVAPAPEPPKAEISQAERDEVAAEQASVERKRKGRRSTILTGPLGDVSETEIQKKTLLGS
tara:strand:+ start:43 stop:261 length:219 start_codon:yes stop_codon:yes gene_type:complete